MRNAIYHIVADAINEVSIIGRKLNRKEATSRNHAWLWKAMAKHPLSQTCRQLRQEFDPVHQHRAITTGVARYRLELENFEVRRTYDFAKLIGCMPKAIRGQLKQNVNRYIPIIRFNLTNHISPSIREVHRKWRNLDTIFSTLQLALDIKIANPYIIFDAYEVNLNYGTPAMSLVQNNLAPAQDVVASAKSHFKKMYDEIYPNGWSGIEDVQGSLAVFGGLFAALDSAHKRHLRLLKEAREKRASKAVEEELRERYKDVLKAELRDGLKEELGAEIMNEMNAEAEIELKS